ncbi:MAG: peptidylprolyl isomerase [Desulfovibrionaceae bacterium]|nr:peptidylprolyl isomerase [Desulfovibrionaceae bacterium]
MCPEGDGGARVSAGSRVAVHYTGTLEDGSVFDTSKQEGRNPLEFVVGEGQVLEGFEKALIGHGVGETVHVTLPPDEAYGHYDPTRLFSVAKAQVPDFIPLEIGTKLQLSSEQGVLFVRISDVGADEVVLDGNHELADETLTFEIEIVEIK